MYFGSESFSNAIWYEFVGTKAEDRNRIRNKHTFTIRHEERRNTIKAFSICFNLGLVFVDSLHVKKMPKMPEMKEMKMREKKKTCNSKWNIWFHLFVSLSATFEIDHRFVRESFGFFSQFHTFIWTMLCEFTYYVYQHIYSSLGFALCLANAARYSHGRVRHSSFGEWK